MNRITAGLLAALALAGAAPAMAATPKVTNTEQLLLAAGFVATPPEPGDEALRPKKLVAEPAGPGFRYVYADERNCDCVYRGDAAAYGRYHNLSVKQRIADDRSWRWAGGWYGGWGWRPWGFGWHRW